MLLSLCLVCLLSARCPALPAPQLDYGEDNNITQAVPQQSDGLADILKLGAELAQNLMALLANKVNFLVELLSDKEVQDTVGQTISAGMNLTGQLTRAAVPVVQGLIVAVPEVVGDSSKFVHSIISAANDTAPIVLEGITEFTDQLPLIAGFASAYAEVNAEQTQKVVQTFSLSLSCNLECQDLTLTPQEKSDCEAKFCQGLPEEDDYYSYSV